MSSAADASADQELLSYDFDKEGKSCACALIMSMCSICGITWNSLRMDIMV